MFRYLSCINLILLKKHMCSRRRYGVKKKKNTDKKVEGDLPLMIC